MRNHKVHTYQIQYISALSCTNNGVPKTHFSMIPLVIWIDMCVIL
jgi:hypothetical protein